jgi:hypothetical protein
MTTKSKLEKILEDESEKLLLTAITKARAGDVPALKMALDRLMPVRERMLTLTDFPEVGAIADLPKAAAFVVKAVAEGRVTPGEGASLVSLLGGLRQAHETAELADRLAAVERALPGLTTNSGHASGIGSYQQ